MTVVAFAPKEAFKDPDSLGAVYVNDHVEVNVRERVSESADGVFVVDNPAVIEALDKYEPLKRVKVPQEVTDAEKAAAAAAAANEAASLEAAAQQAADAEKDDKAPKRGRTTGGEK